MEETIMFCPNCGTQLPGGTKFCPNCGKSLVQNEAPAADAAAEVYTAGQAAAEAVTETVETAAKQTEEAVEQAVEPVAEAVTETVETALEQTAEAVEQAVEPVAEAVTEVAEQAAAAAGEAAEAVEQAAEPVIEAVEETAEAAAERIPEMPSQEGAMPVLEAEPVAEPVPAAVTPEAVPQTAESPYAAPPQKTEKKSKRPLIIALLTVVVLAAAFFVYWNLPANRLSRALTAAAEKYEAGSYAESAEYCRKALEIEPENEDALALVDTMYSNTVDTFNNHLDSGLYEEARGDADMLIAIDPSATDDYGYALELVYSDWVEELAGSGQLDQADLVLARADSDTAVTDESMEHINESYQRGSTRYSAYTSLGSEGASIAGYIGQGDYYNAILALEDAANDLGVYLSADGTVPVVIETGDGKGYEYNSNSSALQFYFGDIADGMRNGEGVLIFIKNYGTSSPSYEVVQTTWDDGDANGAAIEINYRASGGEVTNEVSNKVEGVLVGGYYDGDIAQTVSSGNTYYMKFENGKVVVLDTVDPNGDECNVVGYTEDKNAWVTFSDDSLNGNYGVRYIK